MRVAENKCLCPHANRERDRSLVRIELRRRFYLRMTSLRISLQGFSSIEGKTQKGNGYRCSLYDASMERLYASQSSAQVTGRLQP